jgi:hypothetical protein
MNESLFIELAKQVPNLVIFLLIIYMFQKGDEKKELQRVENARRLEDKREAHEKALEVGRQAHDTQMNNMWANYIKSIIDQQNATFKVIMDALNDHELASKERYERMGITKELLDAAKEVARQHSRRQ